jgi:ribose transport system ATP-binding protein
VTHFDPRLEIRRLSKTFGETKVLSGVALSVAPGELHGIAGQNGCGKSTLVKILTGYHAPDPGAEYHVNGRPITFPVRWRQAHAAGVSVVHQDLGLLDEASVAENICVGGFPTTRFGHRIDRNRSRQVAQQVLARLDVNLDPSTLVGDLNASQRAEVAVARALRDEHSGTGLMILDESSRALSGVELARFHRMLRRLVRRGGSVIMISHNLPELLTVCDRVTVLRDGCIAAHGVPTQELGEPELARLMLGKDVPTLVRADQGNTGTPLPERVIVTGLRSKAMANLDLTVGAGEVVGITGLAGSGYEDIPYLLSGARRAEAGELRTGSQTLDLRKTDVRGCIRAGIALVPERREREGLAFDQSVRDNIALPTIARRGRPWFVGHRWQDIGARTAIKTLGIRPDRPEVLVKQLSGGNQQKVLLAKWLASTPSLLVLHEPTQAVDVGARHDILTAIRQAAGDGVSVVMVSSEPIDLVAACDRILLYGQQGSLEEVPRDVDEIIDRTYGTHLPIVTTPQTTTPFEGRERT